MADYDVSEALSKIEDMLISSMMRNLRHHLDLEKQEGISYTQWQAEQLAALADFRESTNTALGDYFKEFNERIGEALQRAYEAGGTEQETKILEALRKGWKRRPHSGQLSGSFFRINERRLNAYIASVKKDMERAEYALMRMADDQYRKAIFNAGVAYNTGAVTLPQAVDQATNDFLSRGLNCIEYRNGRRVNIDAYAEMAVRTSVTRSYLQGESAKRDEWGVNTVIVNKRGIACPKCLQYVGRVFYDDVYGHVKPQDGKYPLLSSAIAGGLYHPNCKDIHTTYFEGISSPPEPLTKAEEQKAAEVYDLEQRQRYHERQIRKYKRLSEWTNDPKEKQKYAARLSGWQKLNADFVEEHGDVIKRRREREVARNLRPRVPAPPELLSGKSGVDKSGESGIIKLGSKFVNPTDQLYTNADKIKPIEGYGDIVIHGTPDSLLINGLDGEQWEYGAKEAAEMIRNSREFHGQPIRLIACQTGAKENGIAQQIADELGVEVMAPTEIVNVDIDGEMFLCDNGELAEIWNTSSAEERKDIRQHGEWKVFKPNKR